MIKLDETFRIEPDGFNFTLIKEKLGDINPETGKPTISKGQWYPPTLKDALKSYVRESCRELDGGWQKVFDKLVEIENVIDGVNKKL